MKQEHFVGAHSVRLATRADRDGLRSWLRQEAESDGEGFFYNWRVIQRAYRDGRLSVLVNGCGEPAGFAVHDHEEIVMFAIRKTDRGRDLGRYFVSTLLWAFEHRGSDGVILVQVLKRSVGFWVKVGFQIVPTESSWGFGSDTCIVMVKTFDKTRSAAKCLRRVRVGVTFSCDQLDTNDYAAYGVPIMTEGIVDHDGCVHLLRPCVTMMNFCWKHRVRVRITVNDVPVVVDEPLTRFCEMNEIRMEGTRFFAMSRFACTANVAEALKVVQPAGAEVSPG